MTEQQLKDIQSLAFPDFQITSVGDLISKLLKDYIYYIAAIILLVYLIMGGIQLMLSRGDPKAMQSAQGKITNALIGFVIVIFAYVIVKLIGQIFGIEAFGTLFK